MPSDVEKRTLKPQDLLRVEREEKNKAEDFSADREARDDFNMELSEDNLDTGSDYHFHANGSRRRNKKPYRKHEKDQISLMDVFMGGVKSEIIINTMMFVNSITQPLNQAFSATSRNTVVADRAGNQFIFEDEGMAVTFNTQATIEREAAEIQTKIEELRALDDRLDDLPEPEIARFHGQRARLALQIFNLADEFDMRRHPKTGRYVPSIDRVEALEAINNPHGTMECTGLVCVFRPLAHDGDMRGIKVKVGDQYDQNPQEVIASGDHLKGPNAPQFNLS